MQNENDIALSQKLLNQLRKAGFSAATPLEVGKLKSQLKYANKVNAKAAVFFGEEELKNNSAVVKLLESGEQKNINLDSFVSEAKDLLKSPAPE